MTYRLRTGVSNGRISTDDLGTFSIDDHVVEVDDYETAAALESRFGHVSWAGDDPRPEADAETELPDAGDTAQGTVTSDDVSLQGAGDGGDTDEPAYETYPRDELEAMDWGDLRTLATESDAPGIDGRSSKDEILDTLAEG